MKQMRTAFVVLSMLAAGCASYAPFGGLPTVEQNLKTTPFEAPYRVQVGDTITVTFYRNPELNQETTVRPDGFISLPFVDDIRAAGKTPSEIDDELTLKYRGELAVPDVTVGVTSFAGHRIYVGGEVRSEGVHTLGGGMTLYQAIDQAGGFLDTAKRTQVIVIRRGPDGKPAGHSFDIRQVEHGTNPEQDVPLQPYDIVYVPKSKIANVNLFVAQYIRGLLPITPSQAASAFVY